MSDEPTSPEEKGKAGETAISASSSVHPLARLRQFTPARIALGRTGASLPTSDLLDFGLAHARARDAVHTELDTEVIVRQLQEAGLECIRVHSAATDRPNYLRRPDLGRKLEKESRDRLAALTLPITLDLVFIVADGLSAVAPQRYARPVILAVRELLPDWQIAPVIVAEQARVALGDEIGEILRAQITVMLIGERPGLSAPDSLGIYLTYDPKAGRTDAERNCISNVREAGTSPRQAAQTLHYLLQRARELQLSGVRLKDESAPAGSLASGEAPLPKRQLPFP